MTITEEDIQWNDNYLTGALNNNAIVRNEANRQLLARIESDSTYLLVLLEYCLTKDCNSSNFKLSIILVARIIKQKPDFFLENFQQFQDRFCAVFEYILSVPGSYIQSLLADVFNKAFKIIFSTLEEDQLDEAYHFFDNVFSIAIQNLNTIPFCYYVKYYIKYSKSLEKSLLISLAHVIISEYYPYSQDFDLLQKSIAFFCSITGKISDFTEDLDLIFSQIYDLAEASQSLDQNQFNSFWTAIQDINMAKAEPFFQIAYDFLIKSEDDEINLSLIRFIEAHAFLASSNQVVDIINSLYQTVYNLKIFYPSDFSIVKALCVNDFDTFGYVYALINELLENDDEFSYMIYIVTLFYLSETRLPIFQTTLQEIIPNCKKIFCISIEKYPDNIFSTILTFLSEIMSAFPFNDHVKEIPYFLIEFVAPDSDPDFVANILTTITKGVQSIEKFDFFNILLSNFLACYQEANEEIASLYFYALSIYLPNGRLFPEEQYDVISELIQYFLPCLDLTTQEVQRKEVCITFSIFIFKMFIIDPNLYSEILEKVVHNISVAVSLVHDDHEILNLSAQTLIQYIKFFGDQALEFFHKNDYYTYLYQFLFPTSYNPEQNLLNPYTLVLSYICKHDKNNFNERSNFSTILFRIIACDKRVVNLRNSADCAKKFFYLAVSSKSFQFIIDNLTGLISHLIDIMDTEKLEILIVFLASFIKPSHVERRKMVSDEDDDYEKVYLENFVEILNIIATKLLTLCSQSPTNLSAFLIPLFQTATSLCAYDCDVVHEVFSNIIELINTELNDSEINDEEITNNVCFFIDLADALFQANALRENEAEQIIRIYLIALNDNKFNSIYGDIYTSISLLLLINAEYAIPFMEILKEHWNTLENEYMISILGTLFMMIFALLPDEFNPEEDFELVERISNQFQPSKENCNYYLKSSIEFLSNYPDIPIDIKKNFFHSFIIYLSYQKYCYNIFKVKEEVHEQLLEVVKQLMSELPNCEEIIKSCFPNSPRALQGTLKMLENTSE